MAILRYVAREYGTGRGLCCEGGSPKEQARFDMLLEQALDFRNAVARVAYGNTFDSFVASAGPEMLGLWQRFFAVRETPEWVAGSTLTIADFVLAEAIEHWVTMARERMGGRDVLAEFPDVAAYLGRFVALPSIARYRASPTYLARPFNGATASWR